MATTSIKSINENKTKLVFGNIPGAITDFQSIPESINYHITNGCNYHCKFCFAKYQKCSSRLSLEESKQLITQLAENGCHKLNFAGGEPTLVTYLPELIKFSKNLGLYVSVISNGTKVTEEFLEKCGDSIDLMGLSIDSQFNQTEYQLGRTMKSCKYYENYSHVELIKSRAEMIHNYEIPLKINTTITPLNWQEDMRDFITELAPHRWKVFQVHHINNVNDEFFNDFGQNLTKEQFMQFIERHRELNPVYESSEIMANSYCMITPDGRFYYNENENYAYSEPILNAGVKEAFNQINFSQSRFIERGGAFFRNNLHGKNSKNNIQNNIQEKIMTI